LVFQNDSSMSWVINRKMIFMIRIVSSTVRVSFLAGVALVLAGAVNVYSDDVKVKAQETCPVMGGKIIKTQYVDHDGKRIYVCCKGCIAPIQKDPAKYIKALEADGVTLERVKSE